MGRAGQLPQAAGDCGVRGGEGLLPSGTLSDSPQSLETGPECVLTPEAQGSWGHCGPGARDPCPPEKFLR